MIITTHSYARAGLIGNPSDGYFGKTISFVIRNFRVSVKLWESPHFEIMPSHGDLAKYDSVATFLREQKLFGYYGGMRLMKATIKKFFEYFEKRGTTLDASRAFSIGFESDIPRLVGLSGSSGIVIATLRALQSFYGVSIPREEMPTLALNVEKEELNITAGLQDRVIQTYEGMVYMNFEKSLIESRGYGEYVEMNPAKDVPLYVAYDPDRAEVSDVPHRNLRQLWEKGDIEVHNAMQTFAKLTDQAKAAIEAGDWHALHDAMNANYDTRRKIMPIAPENHRMVEVARSVGCSAKFAGSGGAIVGVFHDGDQYQRLVDALAEIRCEVIRPIIWA